jgi:glutathione synthase/RimK-type ligase-like ATP-grasp enzyme
MPQLIALITYEKEPNLTADDRPLIAELAAAGLSGVPVRWDDRDADWASYAALVVRSCWDYHVRHDEFVRWLDAVERAGVPVFNPVPLIRWNMDKRYLRELQARGIAIPDTIWVERGGLSLAGLLDAAGWSDAIVKPAVSASATDTWRVRARDAGSRQHDFAELSARTTVLVQRFVPEIETIGEWSLVFIGGQLSHSAIKRPRGGDFRVQKEHGGTAVPADPPRDVVAASLDVMAALPIAPLFARIDGVMTEDGYVLMEAECIEPDLFFRFRPESRRKLVRALLG